MPRMLRPVLPIGARSVLLRVALLGVGWWALTEGRLRGWPLAVLVVGAAWLTSRLLVAPGAWRLDLVGCLRFVPFFLRHSFLGGIDVAARALHPRLPLEPGFIDYPLRLPAGPARPFFAASLALLPGTVSAEIRGEHVRIHVLDVRAPVVPTLRALEERVAGVFALAASPGHAPR
jgi:multicomponent Na+:H+ antiporter subunit E